MFIIIFFNFRINLLHLFSCVFNCLGYFSSLIFMKSVFILNVVVGFTLIIRVWSKYTY